MICTNCYTKLEESPNEEYSFPYYCPMCDSGYEANEVASGAIIDENGDIEYLISDKLQKERDEFFEKGGMI